MGDRGKSGDEKRVKNTGEAESLTKHYTYKFGDRAERVAPKTEEIKRDKATRVARKRKTPTESVLSADILDGTLYRPKTEETRVHYEKLLLLLQNFLGDQQLNVIMSAADEILAVLKDDNMSPPQRQKGVAEVLGPVPEDKYTELLRIAQGITDFAEDEADEQNNQELEELGISVVIGGEDEDEDRGLVDEDEDEDEDLDEDPFRQGTDMDMEEEDVEEEMQQEKPQDDLSVDARQIDAFWLQRQLNTLYNDAEKTKDLSRKILEALNQKDERESQNDLLELFEYDHLNFIKVLLHNREKISFCTRLSQASSEEEKQSIIAEMNENPELRTILQELNQEEVDNVSAFKQVLDDEYNKLTKNKKTTISDGSLPYAFEYKAEKLDLDSLAFDQGSHLMINKQCKLPPQTFRIQKKGYEEIGIPGTKLSIEEEEPSFMISQFPEWARIAFPGVKSLNRIQTKLRKTAFETSENFLLCAPTGSGKTNVAMMCILHEIGLYMDHKTGEIDLDTFKIVYVAPMKSLVQEMVHNFSVRLKEFGITVRELSGDMSLTKREIELTQVIVTTPEKWDIITRKSGDRAYTQQVRLVIIDEIHLLHDERGPVLEAIVSRSIRQTEETQQMIRLVGLSATLPGYKDVGIFLRAEDNVFVFENKYRPIPLEQSFIGITVKKPFKRHQLMNQICYEKVMSFPGEQVLVFVHSRKETAKTAKFLRDMAIQNNDLGRFMGEDPAYHELLRSQAEEVRNPDLKDLLPYGIAIHHAGMSRQDRSLIEELYADRQIPVLVSTATLAWGVNLPAHAVIIKGTQMYSPEKGDWTELSAMDIMQMLGRAGRPQYDTKGVGVVITTHNELQYYISLMNQQLPIESQLVKKLADNLNAEIVLGTVQDIKDGVRWLGYTYLYVCMLRNPTLYGISKQEVEEDRTLKNRCYSLIHSAAMLLAKHGMIRYDRKSGNFQVTDFGRIASHYYIPYQSMSIYNEHLRVNTTDMELLRIFSLSTEFKLLNVRADEKSEIEALLDRVPIPIKEGHTEPTAKINALLQVYISNLKLEGFSLISDMVYITQSAGRIMRCLFEMTLRRGWFQVAEKCLNFCKMIANRIWTTQSPLRQFRGSIPEDIIRRIEKKEFNVDQLYELSSQEIGALTRYPQYGKQVHKLVHNIPRLDLTKSTTVQPIARSILRVDLTITPDFEWNEDYLGRSQNFWIFVIDVDGETILHYEPFILKKKFATEEHYMTFTVPMSEPTPPQYFIKVISDRWLGCESTQPISFKNLIPPEKYFTTELLDLQRLPISSLKHDAFIQIYENTAMTHLNVVQTQCFNALFQTDLNTLVSAPAGTGKLFCAELAVLREFSKDTYGKIVMICSVREKVANVLSQWQETFGRGLGKQVNAFIGDMATDVKILANSDIVIATPEQWDVLSRRWKKQRLIQNVSLFIVYDLHMIGSPEIGPAIEVIVSRMRYISQQLKDGLGLQHQMRIVALAASVANAKDIGDWIGCTNSSFFAFKPEDRPVPLELHTQGFESINQLTKIYSMVRPCMSALTKNLDKSCIIFVPSRKVGRMLIHALITYCQSQKDFKFGNEEESPNVLTKHFSTNLMLESLSYGIGFYNETLSNVQKNYIQTLFHEEKLGVMVVTKDECWSLTIRAPHVIIFGTEYYEGKDHKYVDYPIANIIQMIGYAGTQDRDKYAICTLLCNAPRKEYYKKFIYESLPIESQLDRSLHDHFNAEVVTKVIENMQDAVDYLTWTFFYRRVQKNPNYYNLLGLSHRHLSDHLSELAEETINDLEQAKCVAIDGSDISTLNAGMIAAFYYLKYTTIELFNFSLSSKNKKKGLLEILSNASEFEDMPLRHKEDAMIDQLSKHLPLPIKSEDHLTTSTKVNVLLQSHFSRHELPVDLNSDLNFILSKGCELLQAMVDVIATNGWLIPAIAAMEMSQMIVQAVWDSDSVFKQFPHFTSDMIERLKQIEPECETIFDFLELDDAKRTAALEGLNNKQIADIASVCNRFPNIDVEYQLVNEEVEEGASMAISVSLSREIDESFTTEVHAPYYPKKKVEGWWIVFGNPKTNQLVAIKRVTLNKDSTNIQLVCNAPNNPGENIYTLYLISDSWIGCDQEYEVPFTVLRSDGERMETE